MALGVRPGCGGNGRHLANGHCGQPGEHIAQVSQRFDAAAAATLHDGVADRSAMTGFDLTDEQPVLLPESRGANGILDGVIVDGDAPVIEEDFQSRPLVRV